MFGKLGSLDLVRSYVVFNESKNIVVAAEKLGISQPLLSKQLKALEEQMGQSLFHFEGRKKMPNHFGRQLYEVFRDNLEKLQSDTEKLQMRFSDVNAARVRVGGRREILERIAGGTAFLGRLEYLPMSGADVLRGLKNRVVELGISQTPIDSLDFVAKSFFKDRELLVWSESLNIDRGAMGKCLEELCDYEYISYGNEASLRKLLQLYKITKYPKIAKIFPNWQVVVELIREGKFWSLPPDIFVRDESKILSLTLPEKVFKPTEFFLLYSREFSDLKWFRELVSTLINSVGD